MTPEMRRLCNLVTNRNWVFDTLGSKASDKAELIVRSILTELKEVSDDTAEAGRWPAEDDGPVACLRAMLDHILTDPTAPR